MDLEARADDDDEGARLVAARSMEVGAWLAGLGAGEDVVATFRAEGIRPFLLHVCIAAVSVGSLSSSLIISPTTAPKGLVSFSLL